jgi:excisionase family DNA binding protein
MLTSADSKEHRSKLEKKKELSRVNEILTPSQVAALLQIHIKTVYRLSEEGVIPGNRIGRSWRFSKVDILDLVSNKQRKRSVYGRAMAVKKQRRHG